MATTARLKKQSLRKDISRDTVHFLVDWLQHHIDIDDRKYADHIQARFETAVALA